MKWATFTYTTPHIRKITNIFKQTNVKIAFKTNNTILQLTRPTTKTLIPPHASSGVYTLTCNTWKQIYVGQTSQSLQLRYQEHTYCIKNNNPHSAYALHVLQNWHKYGPRNQTMHLLKPINNNSSLIPYERLYIQSLHQRKKLIPEQSLGDLNPLFQLVIDAYHPTTWQNQSHGTIKTVHTTHAAALRTTTHLQTQVCKMYLNF